MATDGKSSACRSASRGKSHESDYHMLLRNILLQDLCHNCPAISAEKLESICNQTLNKAICSVLLVSPIPALHS